MFTITQTVKYVDDKGKETKPEYVRIWDDVEKISVVANFENAYNQAMLKLSNLSLYKLKGQGQPVPVTNPVEMQIDILIEEDGVKWMHIHSEYPKMGEEQQAFFLGTIDGELSMIPGPARGKEKQKPPKK